MLPYLDSNSSQDKQWTDELTQLPTLHVWSHYVELLLIDKEDFQVVVINIDKLQELTNTVCLDVRNKIIQKISKRLVIFAGNALRVCRLNDNNFVCWGKFQENHLLDLIKVFSLPIFEENQSFFFPINIGIANSYSDGVTVCSLIDCASSSSMIAKSNGENTWYYFSSKQEAEKQLTAKLILNLKQALFHGDELFLLYQPQCDLTNNELIGVEVLTRWHNNEFGNISPAVFIELAENNNLINYLSTWVFNQVDIQDKKWQSKGFFLPKYSINISGKEIDDAQSFEKIKKSLNNINIDLKRITLEITETVFLSNLDTTKEKLKLLKDSGVSLALDDFGIGYSSLLYLKELPFDTIKIDRAFLLNAAHDSVTSIIFESLVKMVDQLGLRVIVEGVETPEHRQFLLNKKINFAQGYAIAKPLSESDLLKFCKK